MFATGLIMFALPISMPRFKCINFGQNSPKVKLFLQTQKFQALGAPPPDPPASGGWGLCPQTPNGLRRLGAKTPDPKTQPTPLPISGYAPELLILLEDECTKQSVSI